MTSKIFKYILFVAIAVLIASLLIVTGVLYQYYGNLQKLQLRDVLNLTADATEDLGQAYLKKFDSDRYRFTWINTEGKVIFDSHADINTMENHKDREEVEEAFQNGFGSSVRRSPTLTEQTVYEAVRLKNGTVLRISISRATVIMLMLKMIQPIAAVVAISILLSAFLAGRITKKAVDTTEQVNAEKHRREFTANVSHELKTPLQSIIGSAELMENGIVKAEDLPRFIGHIRKEAMRLVDLINDIIHLSQLDEENEMPKEVFSLKEVLEEVRETLWDAAGIKNIKFEVKCEDIKMTGVRRLLYEIIYNLCDNGIKYNRDGGEVKVSVFSDEKEIILSVEDSGIGIDPVYHEKVFERFYRVDKSHSKQSGGTGLGLSIVKHAVLYHQGKIFIESQLQKGTKITVHFPKNVY